MFVRVRNVCRQHGASVLVGGGACLQGVKRITAATIVKIVFGRGVSETPVLVQPLRRR